MNMDEDATCKSFLQVRQEGNRQVAREILFYNLDTIKALNAKAKGNQG